MLKKTKLKPVFSLIPYISNGRQRLWTSASPHANILKVWVETEHVLVCINCLWTCFLQLKLKILIFFPSYLPAQGYVTQLPSDVSSSEVTNIEWELLVCVQS